MLKYQINSIKYIFFMAHINGKDKQIITEIKKTAETAPT